MVKKIKKPIVYLHCYDVPFEEKFPCKYNDDSIDWEDDNEKYENGTVIKCYSKLDFVFKTFVYCLLYDCIDFYNTEKELKKEIGDIYEDSF